MLPVRFFVRKNSRSCRLIFLLQCVILILYDRGTIRGNKKFRRGITRDQLIEENYLMCNFALQDVGQYIRKLFPRFHQFELEIDDCMKIVPYLIDQENYTFLPKDMADTYIREKKLREVKLLDYRTPVINSYIIYRKSKKALLRGLI